MNKPAWPNEIYRVQTKTVWIDTTGRVANQFIIH
jgi:hypothetical protein